MYQRKSSAPKLLNFTNELRGVLCFLPCVFCCGSLQYKTQVPGAKAISNCRIRCSPLLWNEPFSCGQWVLWYTANICDWRDGFLGLTINIWTWSLVMLRRPGIFYRNHLQQTWAAAIRRHASKLCGGCASQFFLVKTHRRLTLPTSRKQIWSLLQTREASKRHSVASKTNRPFQTDTIQIALPWNIFE